MDALGGVTKATYDSIGQLIRFTNANGHITALAMMQSAS